MAIMCLYSRLEVAPATYDAIRIEVDWEGRVPEGAVAHFIGFRNGSAAEVDIWESHAAYEHYRDTRLKPVLAKMGVVVGEPEIIELHKGAVGGPSLDSYLVPRAVTRAAASA